MFYSWHNDSGTLGFLGTVAYNKLELGGTSVSVLSGYTTACTPITSAYQGADPNGNFGAAAFGGCNAAGTAFANPSLVPKTTNGGPALTATSLVPINLNSGSFVQTEERLTFQGKIQWDPTSSLHVSLSGYLVNGNDSSYSQAILSNIGGDPLVIAADYTMHTAYLGDGSDFTIDKRPDNYEYAGLIRRVFPDAIVIVLDRHPMDALFGAYKRAFAPGAHGWSYTMEDLAAHYHNFRGLVAHWRAVMGDGIIDVSLETLIADPEPEIRRLLDRCGLPFDDRCLRPHEAKGAVTTASALQLRQPINAKGVGAWKRYAEHLAPLRDRLLSLGYAV